MSTKTTMSTNVATRTKPKVTKYFGWQQAAALLTTVTVLWLAWQLRGSLEDLISYGYVGAFLAMFVSSATIILPAPGIVMVFAIAAAGANPILVGLFAGIGAGLGELVGYFAGYSGSEAINDSARYRKIKTKLENNPKNAIWTLVILAFIPNPFFDLAGLAAGALKFSLRDFLFATIAGKTLRTMLIALAGFYSIDWLGSLAL